MNINPQTMVKDDIYNVKYRQSETVCEPMLF